VEKTVADIVLDRIAHAPLPVQSENPSTLFSRSLLRKALAAGGLRWLPAALVFGSIAAVAYADFIVSSISLGYLYFLPLGIGAMFLRSRVSYGLIAVCVFLHDLFGPPYSSPEARITHNLTAAVGFTFVVYVIQTYVKQRETAGPGCARAARSTATRRWISCPGSEDVPAQPSAFHRGTRDRRHHATRQRR